MDNYKALELGKKIVGKKLGDYEIKRLLNNGKSAAVFKATNEKDVHVAVKLFDNELIERFGHEVQEKRIEQEIALKNHGIEGLVSIIDGGKTEINKNSYYFLIMEYVDGSNLKQFIQEKKYDEDFISRVGKTLLKITEELIKRGIAHRDIKPENIMIDGSQRIILMDLGVLKLIGAKSFSDYEEKQFVGTLRYAPPEFLTRTEQDTIDGWRAVNYYQIGGVLHDLIMGSELFQTEVPYSNLVYAIKEKNPSISSSNFSYGIVQLARNLMVKDCKKRLEINNVETILKQFNENAISKTDLEKEIESIKSLTDEHRARFEDIEKIKSTNEEKRRRKVDIAKKIKSITDKCFDDLKTRNIFTNVISSRTFEFSKDTRKRVDSEINNFLYKIDGDLQTGYPRPLHILLRFENDENSFTTIEAVGIFFPGPVNLDSPLRDFENASTQTGFINSSTYGNDFFFKPIKLFEGVFDSNDTGLSDTITIKIAKLIKVSLANIAAEVKDELNFQQKLIETKGRNTTRVHPEKKAVVIEHID